ncbi:hypothetical protein HDV00_000803 [Rhizophlyctis rosea]|nr:hypothetical protein HDV00_000803 [Rhizophlyctis rosea]
MDQDAPTLLDRFGMDETNIDMADIQLQPQDQHPIEVPDRPLKRKSKSAHYHNHPIVFETESIHPVKPATAEMRKGSQKQKPRTMPSVFRPNGTIPVPGYSAGISPATMSPSEIRKAMICGYAYGGVGYGYPYDQVMGCNGGVYRNPPINFNNLVKQESGEQGTPDVQQGGVDVGGTSMDGGVVTVKNRRKLRDLVPMPVRYSPIGVDELTSPVVSRPAEEPHHVDLTMGLYADGSGDIGNGTGSSPADDDNPETEEDEHGKAAKRIKTEETEDEDEEIIIVDEEGPGVCVVGGGDGVGLPRFDNKRSPGKRKRRKGKAKLTGRKQSRPTTRLTQMIENKSVAAPLVSNVLTQSPAKAVHIPTANKTRSFDAGKKGLLRYRHSMDWCLKELQDMKDRRRLLTKASPDTATTFYETSTTSTTPPNDLKLEAKRLSTRMDGMIEQLGGASQREIEAALVFSRPKRTRGGSRKADDVCGGEEEVMEEGVVQGGRVRTRRMAAREGGGSGGGGRVGSVGVGSGVRTRGAGGQKKVEEVDEAETETDEEVKNIDVMSEGGKGRGGRMEEGDGEDNGVEGNGGRRSRRVGKARRRAGASRLLNSEA